MSNKSSLIAPKINKEYYSEVSHSLEREHRSFNVLKNDIKTLDKHSMFTSKFLLTPHINKI